jgi:hypothetical protein
MCIHEKEWAVEKHEDGSETLIDGICSRNGLECSSLRCPIAAEEKKLYWEGSTPFTEFDF